MNRKEAIWKWVRGPVNKAGEHVEMRYGSAKDSGWDDWIPVALVSPPAGNTFKVEVLIPDNIPENQEIIKEVENELNFYLVEKGEKNPWAYARYHCGTSANVYSMVHWSFYPAGTWSPKTS